MARTTLLQRYHVVAVVAMLGAALQAHHARASLPFNAGEWKTLCETQYQTSCPDDTNVVCAADGKSYKNLCYALCRANPDNLYGDLTYGFCEPIAPRSKVPCRDMSTAYEPVCGTDGVTYHNRDVILCQRGREASAGTCPICPNDIFRFCHSRVGRRALRSHGGGLVVDNAIGNVCGTNGQTYCSKCVAATLLKSVASAGSCAAPGCLQQGSVCMTAANNCCGGAACTPNTKLANGLGYCT